MVGSGNIVAGFKSPTRADVLRLLDAIMQEDPPVSDSRVAPYAVDFKNRHAHWVNDPRIVGYGYFGKVDAQRSSAASHVIAIYTNSDQDALTLRDKVIPKTVRLRTGGPAFNVNIISIGSLSPSMSTERTRPIRPGISISHHKMTSGTLGAFTTLRDADDGDIYLLSCNHVLTEYNALSAGDAILQPGRSDTGRVPGDVVAELSHMVELVYDDRAFLNKADAALACVKQPSILPEGASSLVPIKINRTVRRDGAVHMVGRTSGRSYGRVLDPSARLHIPYPRNSRSTSKVGFTDVVLCSPFTRRGDSGAAVLDAAGNVVGLVIGGSDRATVFCKIGNVCDALNINLVSVAS